MLIICFPFFRSSVDSTAWRGRISLSFIVKEILYRKSRNFAALIEQTNLNFLYTSWFVFIALDLTILSHQYFEFEKFVKPRLPCRSDSQLQLQQQHQQQLQQHQQQLQQHQQQLPQHQQQLPQHQQQLPRMAVNVYNTRHQIPDSFVKNLRTKDMIFEGKNMDLLRI
jgi:hypothetical protein